MQAFTEYFLPAYHHVVDSSGITVPVPNDSLNRNETLEILFEHRPTTTKEPMAKSSYVCFVRVAFRIADFLDVSAMQTFSVTDETLKKLRDYSKLHGDPDAILAKLKAGNHLSSVAVENLKKGGYNI